MAKLKSFKRNAAAIDAGEWIAVGEEYDDLEILTRGLTDQYADAVASKQRKAAVGYGGNIDKLPVAVRRKINVECLISHVVLDVRNLEGDDGEPVSFAAFCAMLRDPDYADLVTACFSAALRVGTARAADTEEAAGN